MFPWQSLETVVKIKNGRLTSEMVITTKVYCHLITRAAAALPRFTTLWPFRGRHCHDVSKFLVQPGLSYLDGRKSVTPASKPSALVRKPKIEKINIQNPAKLYAARKMAIARPEGC